MAGVTPRGSRELTTMGLMRDLLITASAVLALWTATAARQTVSGAADARLSAQVDALFLGQIRPDGPGCAVGVYRNGEIVLARGYGVANIEDGRPITPRSTFNLGSLSKPFTALAALMLEQRGRLSLNDDVRRWVPELPDYGRPIRVHDLLQHTSGLRDFQTLQVLSGRSVATQPEFLGLIASQRGLNFEPGTRHEYSHTDYGLLGLLVERVAGVPFGEHLRTAVFEPMGMRATFVDDGGGRSLRDRAFGHQVSPRGPSVHFPDSQTYGGDNVYASVEDFARWDRSFTQPVDGGAVVIERMLSRPKLPSGDTIPYAYGLRHGVYRGLQTISRGGHPPGTRTEVIRFPKQQFAVATLCNSDSLEARSLAERVADLYLGAEMTSVARRAAPPPVASVSPAEMARYAGIYRPVDDPWNLLPVEVRQGVLGEVLFHEVTDEAFYPMSPAGGGRFFEIGRTGNVGLFTFRSSASAARHRLEVSWSDGPIEVLEQIRDSAIWRPSAAALAAYAGTWFSPDLDASWQLETRDARLVLRRRGQRDLTLRPVARDQFLRGFGPDGEVSVRLQFHRDSARRLTALTVSTPPGEDAVSNLGFTRLLANKAQRRKDRMRRDGVRSWGND